MEIERIGPGAPRIRQAIDLFETVAARRAERTTHSAPAENWAAAAGGSGPTPRADAVEFSDRVRELARAQRAVEAAPDVRADRVADIKRRLADGTYYVAPDGLARKLLGVNNGDG